ncbi:MAG: outer membrane protein assembly factor BamA [Rhizobiaceae bacterium]
MKPFIQLSAAFVRIMAILLMVASIPAFVASTPLTSGAYAAVVSSIDVRGNQRVDADTIRSYITIKPGKSFSSFDTDESVQNLFGTGLFADVRITTSGRRLLVQVEENPTINLVLFEGNDKVRDDQLRGVVQSQSLGIFSQDKVDSDIERIREAVRRSGRASANVTARVNQLDSNRVNVVFQINEGDRTKITSIDFIGNNAYSDNRLMEVISHNESNFLSWLKRDDIYDPDRLQADEGRLRTFYYNRGYADFRVVSSIGEFDAAGNAYSITITVDEGELYRFGSVEIDNALPVVDAAELRSELEISPGDIYSARDVERSLVAMTNAISRSGYAFSEVTPRGDRNFDDRTIDITFFVDEGPRVYIERIDVLGNDRTRDYVIRREFDVSEGDAYNKVLVDQGKGRLDRLGFFDAVRVNTRQGSAPDRVVVVIQVKDKATGEFAIGGGYSTNGGPIAEISLTEKNFLGRGQYLKISTGIGQDARKYELSFTEPYFLGHRIAAGFDITSQETDSNSDANFSSETILGRLRASAPLTEKLTLGTNYTIKNEKLSSASTSLAVQDAVSRSPFLTSSVGYSLTYSDLDSFRSPREGIYARLDQDFAGVGGDAQYVRTTGRAVGYYLASEDADIVLMGALGAGHIYNWGSDNLRITDHFFQGGETIRGFSNRGIGPREGTEAVGGTTYYNATAEVRFPFFFLPRSYGISAALFADVGTLYDNNTVATAVQDSQSLRASVGASIIWESPFGPLRADFGHAVLKESFDETQIFRFGISSSF